MSERIEKGDCVMIVRGHSCALNRYSGIPYIVGAIGPAPYGMKCNLCGEIGIEAPCDYADLQAIMVPMRWLKKIKPLGEGERSITRAETGSARTRAEDMERQIMAARADKGGVIQPFLTSK